MKRPIKKIVGLILISAFVLLIAGCASKAPSGESPYDRAHRMSNQGHKELDRQF